MMLKRLRQFWKVITTYDVLLESHEDLQDQVVTLRKRLRELSRTIEIRTDIHVDLSPMPARDPHQVIVCGRYGRVDYVQTFSLDTQDFSELIRRLQHMKQHGTVRTIDAPAGLRAVVMRELSRD